VVAADTGAAIERDINPLSKAKTLKGR